MNNARALKDLASIEAEKELKAKSKHDQDEFGWPGVSESNMG